MNRLSPQDERELFGSDAEYRATWQAKCDAAIEEAHEFGELGKLTWKEFVALCARQKIGGAK